MDGITFTPTQDLRISEEDAWELRRSQLVYIDWCKEQYNTPYGMKFPEVFTDKIAGAQKMIDRLDTLIYGFEER